MKLFMTSGMNWGKGNIVDPIGVNQEKTQMIYQILLFQMINMIKYVKTYTS